MRCLSLRRPPAFSLRPNSPPAESVPDNWPLVCHGENGRHRRWSARKPAPYSARLPVASSTVSTAGSPPPPVAPPVQFAYLLIQHCQQFQTVLPFAPRPLL